MVIIYIVLQCAPAGNFITMMHMCHLLILSFSTLKDCFFFTIYTVSNDLLCTITSEHAEKYGYGVVERFVGHGVGSVFHSEPLIYHHRKLSSLSFLFRVSFFCILPKWFCFFFYFVTHCYLAWPGNEEPGHMVEGQTFTIGEWSALCSKINIAFLGKFSFRSCC